MKQHLSTDALVDRLYGVGNSEHLDECAECRQRLEQLRERQAISAVPFPASHEFLAAQRKSIYARMGERPQMGRKWVPALAAAACMIAAGVFVYHPAEQAASQAVSHTAKPEIDSAQLFSDVYSMEQSMEPLAAKPIHAIFEQDQ